MLTPAHNWYVRCMYEVSILLKWVSVNSDFTVFIWVQKLVTVKPPLYGHQLHADTLLSSTVFLVSSPCIFSKFNPLKDGPLENVWGGEGGGGGRSTKKIFVQGKIK